MFNNTWCKLFSLSDKELLSVYNNKVNMQIFSELKEKFLMYDYLFLWYIYIHPCFWDVYSSLLKTLFYACMTHSAHDFIFRGMESSSFTVLFLCINSKSCFTGFLAFKMISLFSFSTAFKMKQAEILTKHILEIHWKLKSLTENLYLKYLLPDEWICQHSQLSLTCKLCHDYLSYLLKWYTLAIWR